jgi:hypothetical protein
VSTVRQQSRGPKPVGTLGSSLLVPAEMKGPIKPNLTNSISSRVDGEFDNNFIREMRARVELWAEIVGRWLVEVDCW